MNLRNYNYLLGSFLLLVLAACGGGGSGGGSDGGGATAPGTVSFGLSDAPIDDLSKVVITIDGIELKPKNGDDCDDDLESDDCAYIDHFTENGELTGTIQVDLMTLQGSDNQIIVEEIELDAGEYSQLRLSVIDEDINYSYVEETTGDIKELKVPSDGLKLGGFTVESAGVQVFVLEFDLRKAMTANGKPGEYFRYILKPKGVRVVEVETAASISGTVDTSLFDSNVPCDSKVEPTAGNIIYIYKGQGLVKENLADNFDSTDQSAPIDAIAPYTSQSAADDGSYGIAYLPAGDYTLAFSCEAEDDNPGLYDGIVIPSPEAEIVELTLSEGESKTCNLPVVDGGC
jgi:hypothetical protein